MKRIVVLVGLCFLLPGCAVHQNLQDDETAAPKTPAPAAPQAAKEENTGGAAITVNGKTISTPINGGGGTTSGDSVDGNNQTASEKRTAPSFHKIELDGAYDLSMSCNEAAAIEISAESNLLPLILTEVHDDTLRIYSKRSINSHSAPKVRVSIPALSALTVNGSGDSEINNLSGGAMMLEINGSGSAKLAGRVGNFKVNLMGSGDIKADGLIASAVEIEINGSGSAEVRADKTLNASISGSGSIVYSGSPAVRQNVSGSGEIKKR